MSTEHRTGRAAGRLAGRILGVLLAAGFAAAAIGTSAFAAGTVSLSRVQRSTASGSRSRTGVPDTWDIILFWGQSNMVGDAIGRTAPFTATKQTAPALSQLTDIDEDILLNTLSATATAIAVPDGTAYEYHLPDGTLTPITSTTMVGGIGKDTLGIYAGVTFDTSTGTWQRCRYINGVSVARQSSSAALMTNMVNAFCAEYYKQTGHGVIALMNAVGGTAIQAFLPMTDPDYLPDTGYSDIALYAYIFEGIEASYAGARVAAAAEGMHVEGSYFVSFQGESDLKNAEYGDYYEKVVGNIRSLGFTKGALVETSNEIGEELFAPYVRKMHGIQESLVEEDPDLCLGSSFDYDHYIPDEKTYNGKDAYWRNMWGNLPYSEAYARAALLTDTVYSNRIHLNSAALSMIGRQTADSLATFVAEGN